MDKKVERIVVQSKGSGPKYEREFFLKIEAAVLDGYRIATTELRADLSMRNYRGRFGRAVMYLEGKQPVVEIKEVVKVEDTSTPLADTLKETTTSAAPENKDVKKAPEKEVEKEVEKEAKKQVEKEPSKKKSGKKSSSKKSDK